MNAILGVGMLAATVLLFALAYGQFRRPNPGAWTQIDLGGLAVILPLVVLFMFGVFHLGAFLFTLESETRWLEIVAAAGVSLLVCWLAVPRLMAPALRGARCLIPGFDGVILSEDWKEALWAKFYTAAPRPRTPSELQYSDRKLRPRS